MVWESEDGRIIRGVWQISPGVVVDTEAHEMFVVIAGRATIAIDGGNTFDVGPGDMGVLEQGARSTWTVHETLRKAYQILLPRLVSGAAWVEAEPRPFWLDSPLAPAPADPSRARTAARWPWSAAASRACGRRCRPSRTIPPATSWCWRRRRSPQAQAAATAGSPTRP